METVEKKLTSAPIVAGWSASALAVLLLVGLIYKIIAIFGEARQELAYRQFSTQLEQANYNASEQLLPRIFEHVKLYSLVKTSNHGSSEFRPRAGETNEIIKEFYRVVHLLGNDQFDDAILNFNTLRGEKLQKLLFSMPPKRENTELLKAIQDNFTVFQDEYEKVTKGNLQIPTAIENNKKRILSESILATDIANEFGAFFSLPPKDRIKGETLLFYKSGVLKDLPELNGLPDDLPDLASLKLALDMAGGKVSIGGPNAPEIFKQKLETFREHSGTFATTIKELEVKNQELEVELKRLRRETVKKARDLEKLTKNFLHEACRPVLSPAARMVLGWFV